MTKKLALLPVDGERRPGDTIPLAAPEARILGTGEPPVVNLGGLWKTEARLAYLRKRERDSAQHKLLTLALGNMLRAVLDLDVPTSELSGPSVVLDGVKITVREFILPMPGLDREFRLYVMLGCPFCERENEREFGSREELGEMLCRPTGSCTHCGKPLSARPGSAS
jgi:hypothetical protein